MRVKVRVSVRVRVRVRVGVRVRVRFRVRVRVRARVRVRVRVRVGVRVRVRVRVNLRGQRAAQPRELGTELVELGHVGHLQLGMHMSFSCNDGSRAGGARAHWDQGSSTLASIARFAQRQRGGAVRMECAWRCNPRPPASRPGRARLGSCR